METYPKTLIVALLLLCSDLTARADVLFDNGPAALGAGGYGYFADANDPFYTEAGDVFTATTSGTATQLDFAGMYYGGTTPTTDTFQVSLYSTSAGAPDTLLLTSTLLNLTRNELGPGESETVYEFSGNLQTPFTLTAGDSYYLGITDLTDPYEDFAVDVSGSVPADGSTDEYSHYTGSPGFPAGFYATGPDALSVKLSTAPEASAWMLLAVGCLVLAGSRRALRA